MLVRAISFFGDEEYCEKVMIEQKEETHEIHSGLIRTSGNL